VRLRYETLFARLGPGFDGAHAMTDFDALYCVVEGTAGTAVAEAQARALVALVTDAAVTWGHGGGAERRAGLALDEFSAVAGRVPATAARMCRWRRTGGLRCRCPLRHRSRSLVRDRRRMCRSRPCWDRAAMTPWMTCSAPVAVSGGDRPGGGRV